MKELIYWAKSGIENDRYDKVLSIPFFIETAFKKNSTWWVAGLLHKTNTESDTYAILNKVHDTFLVKVHFLSPHGAFPQYLFKIVKCLNIRCNCGSVGSAQHYLFGPRPLMPCTFKFMRNRTLKWNIRNVLLSRSIYSKLPHIYNALNKEYSFTKYKFQHF